jgi:hypothetical protein
VQRVRGAVHSHRRGRGLLKLQQVGIAATRHGPVFVRQGRLWHGRLHHGVGRATVWRRRILRRRLWQRLEHAIQRRGGDKTFWLVLPTLRRSRVGFQRGRCRITQVGPRLHLRRRRSLARGLAERKAKEGTTVGKMKEAWVRAGPGRAQLQAEKMHASVMPGPVAVGGLTFPSSNIIMSSSSSRGGTSAS